MRIPLPQDASERSKPHRRVEKLLDKMGISFLSEERFPPYKIDILLPEFYAGIEVDGPFHNKKHDQVRDAYLLEYYKLPILRLKDVGLFRNSQKLEDEIIAFIEEHGYDVLDRKTSSAPRFGS